MRGTSVWGVGRWWCRSSCASGETIDPNAPRRRGRRPRRRRPRPPRSTADAGGRGRIVPSRARRRARGRRPRRATARPCGRHSPIRVPRPAGVGPAACDPRAGEGPGVVPPVGASRSGAPVGASRSGAPVGASRSGAPVGASRSGAPVGASRSGAPVGASRSGAPVGASRSGAPVGASRSGAPVGASRSGAPVGATIGRRHRRCDAYSDGHRCGRRTSRLGSLVPVGDEVGVERHLGFGAGAEGVCRRPRPGGEGDGDAYPKDRTDPWLYQGVRRAIGSVGGVGWRRSGPCPDSELHCSGARSSGFDHRWGGRSGDRRVSGDAPMLRPWARDECTDPSRGTSEPSSNRARRKGAHREKPTCSQKPDDQREEGRETLTFPSYPGTWVPGWTKAREYATGTRIGDGHGVRDRGGIGARRL